MNVERENQIRENLIKVHEKIEFSAKKAGRNPEEITLVAVSKTYPASDMLLAVNCGEKQFGENRVQELCEKKPVMPEGVKIHLIGHLQSNKVKNAVKNACLIHSVDSVSLAREISKVSVKEEILTEILIQVNVSKDEAKFGIDEKELAEVLKEISVLPGVKVKGLMTVPAIEMDREKTREHFKKLKNLYDTYKDEYGFDTLSMGMSSDFDIAIEEGATLVRVGSDIFGARDYSK